MNEPNNNQSPSASAAGNADTMGSAQQGGHGQRGREQELRFFDDLPAVSGPYLHESYGKVYYIDVKVDENGVHWTSNGIWVKCCSSTHGRWCGPLVYAKPCDHAAEPSGEQDETPAAIAQLEAEALSVEELLEVREYLKSEPSGEQGGVPPKPATADEWQAACHDWQQRCFSARKTLKRRLDHIKALEAANGELHCILVEAVGTSDARRSNTDLAKALIRHRDELLAKHSSVIAWREGAPPDTTDWRSRCERAERKVSELTAELSVEGHALRSAATFIASAATESFFLEMPASSRAKLRATLAKAESDIEAAISPNSRRMLIKQEFEIAHWKESADTMLAKVAKLRDECDRFVNDNAELIRRLDAALDEAAELRGEVNRLKALKELAHKVAGNEIERAAQERDKLFNAIKEHHDQKADDRCWLDDDVLYEAAGLDPVDRHVGDKNAMLENCKRFLVKRCEPGKWPTYVELEADLAKLRAQLARIRGALAGIMNFHDWLEALGWLPHKQQHWWIKDGMSAVGAAAVAIEVAAIVGESGGGEKESEVKDA